MLQLVVSRSQGDARLGQFALLLGTLITLNAVQSGWIGDSLTVLDRHDPAVRAALWRYQVMAWVLLAAIAGGVAWAVPGVDPGTAVLFAVVMVLWATEETGRRLLIARRQFWALAVNDVAYAVGAITTLLAAVATDRSMSLDLVLVAMAVGALTAIGVAAIQLPGDEVRPARGTRPAMREVASFAFWRSLQVGLRPGALAITRFVVAAAASTAVLGQLEAARIVTAPVLTLMGGVGVYLLPTYSQAAKEGRPPRPSVLSMMGLLAAVPLVYVALVLLVKEPVVEILTDGRYAVSATAIICWGWYAAAFGAGIPPAHAVTATERSRLAFGLRAVDNGVGVALAVVIALAGHMSWVPLGLAIGGVVGAGLLLRASRRHDALAPNPEVAVP